MKKNEKAVNFEGYYKMIVKSDEKDFGKRFIIKAENKEQLFLSENSSYQYEYEQVINFFELDKTPKVFTCDISIEVDYKIVHYREILFRARSVKKVLKEIISSIDKNTEINFLHVKPANFYFIKSKQDIRNNCHILPYMWYPFSNEQVRLFRMKPKVKL